MTHTNHNELNKGSFQYNTYKDLPKRATSDKALCNKAFENACNSKSDWCLFWLAFMVYKFFDKRPRDTTHTESRICDIFSDIIPKKQQLANKLHNPITKKFKKHKVY